jgi:hypothetical protein
MEQNIPPNVDQILEDTKNLLRQQFAAFRDAAFPEAKSNNLDYETVCLIENEFQAQEKICIDSVKDHFDIWQESNQKWLTRYQHALHTYTRMAVLIADSFLTEIRGHHFTYNPSSIPTYLFEKVFEEGRKEHDAFLSKQKMRSERLSRVFDKVMSKIFGEKENSEAIFKKALDKIIDVDMPASHKRVEAIINQNYLQKVGALHGEN